MGTVDIPAAPVINVNVRPQLQESDGVDGTNRRIANY